MEFMLNLDQFAKDSTFMDMSNIWIYNLDKNAFKSKYADAMNSNVIKEILNCLNVESLNDLAIFVPPWESFPVQRGIKYDYLWNELRQGRKTYEKLIAGNRLVVCNHYQTPYVIVFQSASSVNPSFIAFRKGSQPSI